MSKENEKGMKFLMAKDVTDMTKEQIKQLIAEYRYAIDVVNTENAMYQHYYEKHLMAANVAALVVDNVAASVNDLSGGNQQQSTHQTLLVRNHSRSRVFSTDKRIRLTVKQQCTVAVSAIDETKRRIKQVVEENDAVLANRVETCLANIRMEDCRMRIKREELRALLRRQTVQDRPTRSVDNAELKIRVAASLAHLKALEGQLARTKVTVALTAQRLRTPKDRLVVALDKRKALEKDSNTRRELIRYFKAQIITTEQEIVTERATYERLDVLQSRYKVPKSQEVINTLIARDFIEQEIEKHALTKNKVAVSRRPTGSKLKMQQTLMGIGKDATGKNKQRSC